MMNAASNRTLAAAALAATLAAPAPAELVFTIEYGIEFSTIGDHRNASFAGPSPYGYPHLEGRGSVGYEYRIARKEVSTAQWMEFVNTFSTQGNHLAFFGFPTWWGASQDLSYQGPGRRYRLNPDFPYPAEMGVFDITWREAAMYCNWFHNGKSSDIESLVTGAYDTMTWGWNPATQSFTDEERHLPGARFWLPTVDEWMKATYWDPDRHGEDEGGWWLYPNQSDEPPVHGLPEAYPSPPLPGPGTSSAGSGYASSYVWLPLGAYEELQSPWGLWDTTGAAREWTEDWVFPESRQYRFLGGAGLDDDWLELSDHISVMAGTGPDSGGNYSGVRIASIVPAPASGLFFVMGLPLARRKR